MATRRFPVSTGVSQRLSRSGTQPVPKVNGPASESLPVAMSQLLSGGSFGNSDESGACRTFHARGSRLFTEGQPASGVFIIEKGSVKLSICSGCGRSLILGFFGPQSVLGLAAAILGLPYESSAEILRPVTARFLPRDQLIRRMRSSDAGLHAAELVSDMLYRTWLEIETLWLTHSVEQKLARFLLSLRPLGAARAGPLHLALDLTHDEIAQRIGVSRESVTRAFSRFKRNNVLHLKESVLSFLDFDALQKLADFSGDRRAPEGTRLLSAMCSSAIQPAPLRQKIGVRGRQPSLRKPLL
jgi:CRP-like cAMP-binding protein